MKTKRVLQHGDRGRVAPRLHQKWFAELDQRRLVDGPFLRVVQVDGVHADSRQAWIQIALADQPESSVVLHLSRHATAAQAVAALQAWFDMEAGKRPHVIEVMQLVPTRRP